MKQFVKSIFILKQKKAKKSKKNAAAAEEVLARQGNLCETNTKKRGLSCADWAGMPLYSSDGGR